MNDLLDLFRRARAGDGRAFAALIDDRREAIANFARWCLGQPESALDEIVQEVWIRFWRRIERLEFDAPRQLDAWLLSVCRYVVRERWHSRTTRPEAEPVSPDSLGELSGGAEGVDTRDDLRAVRRTIYLLPRDDQIVLYLVCYLGWSRDDVVASRLLDVRDAAQVGQRLFQARRRLCLELGESSPQLAGRLFGFE
jgi:DNA-directed RNA polymerase specialized sigma24 family protein